MKALPLLKHNIDTILKDRKQTRRDLAQYVRQSMNNKVIDPWISHIFNDPEAEIQMKYLDRIADYLGVRVYQLFQPGISHLTERRKAERRSGRDRRLAAMNQRVRHTLSEAIASLNQADVADMIRMKLLTDASRDRLRDGIKALERSEHPTVRRGRPRLSTEKGGAGGKSGRGRATPPHENEG